MKSWVIPVGARCLCAVLALLLTACPAPKSEPPADESIPDEPLFLLLDAYRGNEKFFLRYRRGDDIFYAAGERAGRGPADPNAPATYETPVMVRMTDGDEDPWDAVTRGLEPVPILDVAAWAELRRRLFGGLMPEEPNSGISVAFDRMDYFFFYDRAGRFRVRRLIDKPAWYTVDRHIDLRAHFEAWQPLLDAFLLENGIEGEDVIFNTGDLDAAAIPFLYINRRTQTIVLVEYADLAGPELGHIPGAHLLQTFWHFVDSHTVTVLMRPFSSIRSLLEVTTDTALQTGRGMQLNLEPVDALPPVGEAEPMDLNVWELELDRILDRPASRGRLAFLVDGEGFFPRFVDALSSARGSIDIRAYIFDDDDVALNVGELLKRRSREGVDVRVLFDGLGSITAKGERSETEPEVHEAPFSVARYLENDSRVEVRKTRNPWLTGDHVKTMVIDRELAFIGGMNIGREYRYEWHDLMVEVTGPVVDLINHEFDQAWGRAGFWGDFSQLYTWRRDEHNAEREGYPVRLIHTKPGKHEIFQLQREAIRRARQYIYIENAYFTEDSLLRELVLARRRGVDVRVIIPVETDRGLITRNIVHAANTLLEHGVRVYIYPGFSHAKAAVFDGWISVGSANLDRLSLRINRETNLASSEPAAAEALIQALFLPDFAASRELVEPLPERWTDHLIEILGDYVF